MKIFRYIFFLLIIILNGAVYPQLSFKTSRLKASEIYNFFQKISGNTGNNYLFKIESSYDFWLDFLSKSKHKNLMLANEYDGYKKDYSKSWSKNKMFYFAVSNPVECKYDELKKQVVIGDTDEFSHLKNYLGAAVNKPVILEKIFKPKNKKSVNPSEAGINEFILCLNILNFDDQFNKVFSNGIFSISKEFESERQASLLLQDCQMVLGIKIPGKDELFVKRDFVGDLTANKTGYNLFHVGVSAFVKRVILFNKTENKIISDVNIE